MNSNSFQLLNELIYKIRFYCETHFALVLVLIIFKHTKYAIQKHCVDMCARHGRGAIENCLSEKGALAKKRLGNTGLNQLCPTRGSWAACGLVEGFVWPSRLFSLCMYNTMTICLYFDNLEFDIFDAMVFSARLSCAMHW